MKFIAALILLLATGCASTENLVKSLTIEVRETQGNGPRIVANFKMYNR